MAEHATVTDVRLTEAPDGQQRLGMLGWIQFTLNCAVLVDGVALRRTRAGRLTLSYPVRHDARGAQHPIVRPVSDAARIAIEVQVLAALHLQPEAAP